MRLAVLLAFACTAACTRGADDFTTLPGTGHGGADGGPPAGGGAGGSAGAASASTGAGTGGASSCAPRSARFGGVDDDRAEGLAAGPDGVLAVCGSFTGSAMLANSPVNGAGQSDVFVAELGPDGAAVWVKTFGGSGIDEALAIAIDAAKNVVVVGAFDGMVDFGQGPVGTRSGQGGFVLKLDPAGGFVFLRKFDTTRPFAVTTDASGDVIVVGRFHGTTDFGLGQVMGDQSDLFVVKLDGATGATSWVKRFGTAEDQTGLAVATGPSNEVVVAGEFTGHLDFGVGDLAASGFDGFVVKLDPMGNPVWSRPFGGSGDQSAKGVAVTAASDVVVVGSFQSDCDFGTGTLTSAGGNDAFVALYDAMGTPVWSKQFGDADDQIASTVVADAGGIVVAGKLQGTADFGGGPLVSAGSVDAFAAALNPSGAHRWSARWGTTQTQAVSGLAVTSCGSLALAGTFETSIDLPTGPLVSAGLVDGWAADVGSVLPL